jgi:RNA polymerase sigma-70 factor (ECF subfamily)
MVLGARVWRWAMSTSTSTSASAKRWGAETDERLVEAALGGERRAYDELYRRHVDDVWRRLTRILGQDPDREDLTQQIFLEVFRHLETFRGDASFRTYLYRVATNVACDQLRRRRRRSRELPFDETLELAAPGGTPEAAAAHRQHVARTWACLESLKPKKRVAFVLRVVEERSLQEIADVTTSNVPTVAKRIAHAHRELMALLRKRDRAGLGGGQGREREQEDDG